MVMAIVSLAYELIEFLQFVQHLTLHQPYITLPQPYIFSDPGVSDADPIAERFGFGKLLDRMEGNGARVLLPPY